MTVHVDLHIRLEELDLQTADGLQKQYVLKAKANGLDQNTVFHDPVLCVDETRRLVMRWLKLLDLMRKDTRKRYPRNLRLVKK